MLRRVPLIAALGASLALLGLGGVSPALAATTPSPDDVTWGVRTGDSAQGSGRQNYDLSVAPGGRIDDAIIISNYDEKALEVDLYAADGFTNASGELDAAPRAEASEAVGVWVTFNEPHISVPAGQAVSVPFSVAVPADVTPGDYAGAVLTTLTRDAATQGITVDRRLGIRMHLRVTGDLAPALAIEGLQVDYAGTPNPFGTGIATVTYTLRNTGNVRLSAEQSIVLTGPLGAFTAAAPALASAPEVLPGETWQVAQQVEGVVPAFALFTTATITPRLAPELLPPGSSPELADVTAQRVSPAVPWSLLVLVLLIAAVVVLVVWLTRRRRSTARAAEEARVQAAVDEALAIERERATLKA
ncbi:WxL protein peptidoglycan domain-containing protein [uncultured Microbacterium sp.]|uniref:WxL protein peptidoglycan domain-containing protein n=1 Tax=uncultured Microbacterium sp. TaxID=191216 RepID=UPI0035CC5D84